VKDVVEMLLGNLLMFPEHFKLQYPAAEERNIDKHAQDPVAMLQSVQITDKPQTIKPQIPPWDPAKDTFANRANLLQGFIPDNLSFCVDGRSWGGSS
jgi:hypothetical protein